MRRFLIAACIAALPALSQAQVPTAVPATVDSSSSDGPSGFLFKVGGFIVNGQRNFAFNGTVTPGTGSLKGVDLLLRGSGAGLAIRSLSGTFTNTNGGAAQPDVISADASLLLGPPAFTVWLGGSKRALSNPKLNLSQVCTFGRVGAQMTFLIGGSGLTGQVGAWGYIPIDSSMKIGGEGEGSISYSPPRIPIYFQLGYRSEVFTSKTKTTTTPEEVRGLRIGGGIQFGGK